MYIDTRNLNARLEDLDEMEERLNCIPDELYEVDSESEEYDDLLREQRYIEVEYEEDEHRTLSYMRDEIPEWEHGATLIPEDDFVEYVKEMLADCGDIPRDIPWYISIDWEQTANNVQQDYSCIEFEGIGYWYRNC